MKSKQYLKRLALVVAVLAAVYLSTGVIAQADGPFMEVRFLRVILNAVINGDLSVLDDLAVTDAITGASVAATGAVSGASGAFTTATIGSATITTLTATSTYTYYETVDVDATGTITANAVNVTGTIAGADVTASGSMTATGGFVGDLTGNVTGNLTGNVTGNIIGSTGVFTTGTFTTAVTSAYVTATSGFVGNLTGNVTGDSAGTHTGAVIGNVTGNTAAITQTATVGKFLRLPAQTAITVTNGAAFTPTGTYQPIQAAGDVTPTIGSGTAGDLVILHNLSDVTITFETDSSLGLPAATAALAQDDTLTLLYDGSKWVTLSVD
jgi:hypothetical protein